MLTAGRLRPSALIHTAALKLVSEIPSTHPHGVALNEELSKCGEQQSSQHLQIPYV